MGFPIQISADQIVFANPRSFSQLITSFFGSQCLGIHPMLLLLNQFSTWSLKCRDTSVYLFSDCEEDFSSYSRLFVQVLPCTLGCLTLFTRIIISFGYSLINVLSWIAPRMEIRGFEPLTPCLQGRCSPNWAISPKCFRIGYFLKNVRHPPIFPCRYQQSIFGRLSLNRRVRDGNGCFP